MEIIINAGHIEEEKNVPQRAQAERPFFATDAVV